MTVMTVTTVTTVTTVIKKKVGCQALYSNINIYLYYYRALFSHSQNLNDSRDSHDNRDSLGNDASND